VQPTEQPTSAVETSVKNVGENAEKSTDENAAKTEQNPAIDETVTTDLYPAAKIINCKSVKKIMYFKTLMTNDKIAWLTEQQLPSDMLSQFLLKRAQKQRLLRKRQRRTIYS